MLNGVGKSGFFRLSQKHNIPVSTGNTLLQVILDLLNLRLFQVGIQMEG